MMRRVKGAVAVLAMVTVVCLGFAGAGSAQTTGLQVQGTLAAVNCRTGELTLNTSGGATTVQATNQSAVYLNGSPIALCSLASYRGAPATAVIVPSDNEFVLGRLDVTAQAAAPAPATVSSGSSALGLALGALAIGAIGYLIGKNSAPPAQTVPVYYGNANNGGYNGNHYNRNYSRNYRCPNNQDQWCRR